MRVGICCQQKQANWIKHEYISLSFASLSRRDSSSYFGQHFKQYSESIS